MKWYWRARIYNSIDHYATIWIATNRVLHEIDTIQDFYRALTGCKMLLEAMSEEKPQAYEEELVQRFKIIWSIHP